MFMLLQVRMEEEEIDGWYEEEKQKFMEEYLKNIETTKNYEEAEKRYNDRLNKLIDKYNQLMIEAIQGRKTGKLKRFISKIKKVFFLIILLLLTLSNNSCAVIGQNQAEAKAVQFVNQNVKFFAREENSTLNLPQYSIDSVSSLQENKNWVVVMHISAKAGNETKKNDLIVKLNRKGDVTEFNGKKVQSIK